MSAHDTKPVPTVGERARTIFAILCFAACAAQGQLYLITGTATPIGEASYAADLMRVGAEGVVLVAELVPATLGTDWIAVSYENRRVLLLSHWHFPADYRAVVFDMDKGATVKECKLPRGPDASMVDRWIADVPGRGLTFEWWDVTDVRNDIQSPALRGFITDPAVPCDGSFLPVDPQEIRYLSAHGRLASPE